MKPLAWLLLLGLAAPAPAQEAAPAEDGDGFSLVEEGVGLIMQGMLTELEPALGEMEQALAGMEPLLKDIGPQLAELMALAGDFRNYDTPVVLPNGDILIRRKAPLPPNFDPVPGAAGEIDL